MPGQGPGPTTRDQILWSQRVVKEDRVNAKVNPHGFSMRNAVTALDVPKKFKPGHCHPKDAAPASGFDPSVLGWAPGGKDVTELQSLLAGQVAVPRERHLFPETTQEAYGWLQRPVAVGRGTARTTLAGALPKAGVGWSKGGGSSWDDPSLPPPSTGGRRSGAGAPAVVPPFAAVSTAAKTAAAEKVRSQLRSSTSAGPGARSEAPSSPARSAVSGMSRARSVPSLKVQLAKNSDASIDAAMAKVRPYLNASSESRRWYHPLATCDVCDFADHYTQSWGVQLYARRQ